MVKGQVMASNYASLHHFVGDVVLVAIDDSILNLHGQGSTPPGGERDTGPNSNGRRIAKAGALLKPKLPRHYQPGRLQALQ